MQTLARYSRQKLGTQAYGGVLTLNVGPAADGTIIPAMSERLLAMGDWLRVNGEGIFSTKPFRIQHSKLSITPAGPAPQPTSIDVFYTAKDGAVYAFLTAWPAARVLLLPGLKGRGAVSASLLGMPALQISAAVITGKGLQISFPSSLGPKSLPCDSAWALKILGVE